MVVGYEFHKLITIFSVKSRVSNAETERFLMNIFIHQENPVATKRKEKNKQTNLIKRRFTVRKFPLEFGTLFLPTPHWVIQRIREREPDISKQTHRFGNQAVYLV